jgi:hypothetical protein
MPTNASSLPVLQGVIISQENPPERTAIDNFDVYNLLERIRAIALEVAGSQSSSMANGLHPDDAARFSDFISDIRRFFEYIEKLPLRDLPETHNRLSYALPTYADVPAPQSVSNKDCAALLMQLLTFWWEVANSQSARLVSGLWKTSSGPGDQVRWRATLDALTEYVSFIGATQPSDRPESSPWQAPTGPGKTGT